MRTEDIGTYEMLWDCGFCGSEKLLANTHKFCSQCGAPQDAAWRYFPTEADRIAVENHEYVGADLICGACTAANPGDSEFCSQCGSPMTEAARAKKQADQVFDADGQLVSADDADKSSPPPRSRKGLILFVIIAVLVIGGIMAFFFMTEEKVVEVIDHAWTREIRIEQFSAVSESAWCDSRPGDAYQISRSREVRSYKQVPDGEECSTRRIDQGDGTYQSVRECRATYRKEPVYDEKCRYKIDRWAYDRSAKASGNDLQPRWPAVNLHRGSGLGAEREAGRDTDLYLNLRSADKEAKSYRCEVDERLWRSARPSSRWQMQVGTLVGDARCGTLKPLGAAER